MPCTAKARENTKLAREMKSERTLKIANLSRTISIKLSCAIGRLGKIEISVP
jgi:hypothetical protein